jgi:hypothetical protein
MATPSLFCRCGNGSVLPTRPPQRVINANPSNKFEVQARLVYRVAESIQGSGCPRSIVRTWVLGDLLVLCTNLHRPKTPQTQTLPEFLPQMVNQQIPQNEHLQNSIKTNIFNSFTINTYEKPGEGDVMVNQQFSSHLMAVTPRTEPRIFPISLPVRVLL